MKKTLGILSALALTGVAHADVNVSGYVDAGYDWTNNAAGNVSAFSYNEGGVWFSGNTGATSFLLDVGVRGPTGTAVVEQGYVSQKHDNGFSWSLGKFDGLLGHESNDSVNNAFVHTGLLYNFTPTNHTGLLLGYDLSDALKLQLVVANGINTKGAGGREFDYPTLGFKVSSKMDGLNAYVGGNFQSQGDENGYQIDIGADSTVGSIDVGAELLLLKAAVKDAESGLGFGIHGSSQIAEATKLNVGFEWENGKSSGVDTKVSTMELRVGPSFALSEALNLKADYTFAKASGDNATGAKAMQGVAVAGVYKF
ncbi:MAG: outer membrane beta-barrel protein [Bdellovibrionota bacterium]